MNYGERQRAIKWLREAEFPPFPFPVRPGITITGPQFRDNLIGRLEDYRPQGDRYGVLRAELMDLWRVSEEWKKAKEKEKAA